MTWFDDDFLDFNSIINKGESECKFDELDASDDGQIYTVVVNVSDFTPKEDGWHYDVGF